MALWVVSTSYALKAVKSGVKTLAAFFLLFIFTFKVGKSYENSVNHGGNTSYQSNDKISCHSQASFNLVIQLSLVEFGRQPPEEPNLPIIKL